MKNTDLPTIQAHHGHVYWDDLWVVIRKTERVFDGQFGTTIGAYVYQHLFLNVNNQLCDS
jgi:hypothetical protein